mmetsp:Transcript_21147/g.42672  ORF Transcript_21147/g.42672 Transcript_21147/m.42672 type:complete len:118 (+) Transcript_21147:203-556(+)
MVQKCLTVCRMGDKAPGLFDSCGMLLCQTERPGPDWKLLRPVGSAEELSSKDSILGDAGRDQIILDAAEDGSSVMCKACGALVRSDRKKAHDQMWCSAIPDEDDEDELAGVAQVSIH